MLKEIVKRSSSLPSNAKMLIFGCGFTGRHIAAAGKALGANVLCTRRQSHKEYADIVFDSEMQIHPSNQDLSTVSHLLSCIPPDKNGEDPLLKALGKQIESMPLQWAGYLSTTGVYGDCAGNWVTEANPPNPGQARSKRRLACENAWRSLDIPLQILRLPGIYGPGRSALDSIKKGQIKMVDKPGQMFSRVHIDDIAGAIFHLIKLSEQGERPSIINIADNLPTTNIEVLEFAASLLGNELPPLEPFEIAASKMSPMALSFWQENRKVSNQMLCQSMGYSLIHPNYQSGLRDCLMQAS